MIEKLDSQKIIHQIPVECLPSTSPANAACSLEKLIAAYKVV